MDRHIGQSFDESMEQPSEGTSGEWSYRAEQSAITEPASPLPYPSAVAPQPAAQVPATMQPTMRRLDAPAQLYEPFNRSLHGPPSRAEEPTRRTWSRTWSPSQEERIHAAGALHAVPATPPQPPQQSQQPLPASDPSSPDHWMWLSEHAQQRPDYYGAARAVSPTAALPTAHVAVPQHLPPSHRTQQPPSHREAALPAVDTPDGSPTPQDSLQPAAAVPTGSRASVGSTGRHSTGSVHGGSTTDKGSVRSIPHSDAPPPYHAHDTDSRADSRATPSPFCDQCGARYVRDTSRFCSECGEPRTGA
eukprot:NODE_2393_length_1074_cov_19.417107_g2375_i0.p2 GENE.NODE_2393_length_1074_cov_19.417107_g2375_i0~~NODE_2393_length_1074_cov_19.417107_g2375_i0.p2  ORF type:complete len:346 (-),score=65.75 NODE_2393_length_1074_cov_19.417107_g2375_i0:37-948(-)